MIRFSRLRPLPRPDFGPQQPQAHLHEPVVQVDQHHVVPALGGGVVEDDRADLLGVRVRPDPRRTPPNCPFKAGSWKTGLPVGHAWSGSDAGCPASSRPTSTTLWMFSGDSRSSRWSRGTAPAVALICFAKSRSNLSIFRTGSASVSACAVFERAYRRPSMASSTCSAITGPTLPRSSRIVSTLLGDPHQEFQVGFQVADRLGERATAPGPCSPCRRSGRR